MSFPRYESYVQSGVTWLGQVPASWAVTKVKRLIRSIEQGWSPQCEGTPAEADTDWAVLKVGCVNGGKFDATENKLLPPELNPVPALSVHRDDVLISRANTRELVGSAAVVERDYPMRMLCDKLYRIRVHPDSCSPRFLTRYLASAAVREQIELAASGASASMLNIGQSAITELAIAIPTIRDQLNIVTFLDREVGRIDELLAEQERFIGLLLDKRQAVTAHAVTGGLNPDAPMKNSGVEWLGAVPSHWQVVRLGGIFGESAEPGDDTLPFLSVSIHNGVSDKEFTDDELDRKVTRSDDRSKYIRVQAGDLVYNMMRAWQGAFGTVKVAGMVSPAYVVARPTSILRTEFIENLLRTPQAIEELRRHSHGVTDFRLRLYWDEFKSIKIALPPLVEQSDILKFLDSETAKISALITESETAIALLQERRSALISATVTGKIDVRGAAAARAETEAAA